MGESQNSKCTTLVLVGKTGNGKSSTGNSILGNKAFKSAGRFTSVTKKCEMRSAIARDGRVLNVVDTPGLFDSSTSLQDVKREIEKCMELAKDGLHAVLFVLSLNRFTPEEASVLDCLQVIFGAEITSYMLVVFTGADTVDEEDMTFEERLNTGPKQLKDLLYRCKNRVVLFDNKTKKQEQKDKQVSELLKQVDVIVAENGGQPYSNELFEKFQTMANRLFGEDQSRSIRDKTDILRQISETVEDRVNNAVAAMKAKTQNEVQALERRIVELTKNRQPKPGPCSIL